MTQLTGLKFVSDVELENPIERHKRLELRLARKAVNRRRYIRQYERRGK
jgi:hypothetical protein